MSVGAEVKEIDPVLLALIGLVAGLVIIIVIMITSLVCTQKSYKRRLKAAKAMNTAAMLGTKSQKTSVVVPGTNKYTMEGANPVLNLNIEEAMDLGFDGECSNADRIRLNFLDYNTDMQMSEKDTMQMMVIEEEDEENACEIQLDEKNTKPLGPALAQRDNTRGSSIQQSYDNPSFSTTDL